MTDFYQHFGGELEMARTNTNNPADQRLSLYDRQTGVRRFDFDSSTSGDTWATDTKTGERAFKIDAQKRVFLPNGQQIPSPKPLPPRDPTPAAKQKFYAPPKPKLPNPFAGFDGALSKPQPGTKKQATVASRLFGTKAR